MSNKPKFEIKGLSFVNKFNEVINTTYFEGDPLENLEGVLLGGVRGYCFYKDKFVLVNSNNDHWGPPGGGMEKGENFDQALRREVLEESNMKILNYEMIGYQDFYTPRYVSRQTLFYCEVEPVGDFDSDPDGDITEIKLIDPKDYKQYFDWGEIGDYVMKRAVEINNK